MRSLTLPVAASGLPCGCCPPVLKVLSVLRSGGEYNPGHVRRLKEEVGRNLTLPHEFICLSDLPGEGYETIPLIHDWPGWWSKLELFRQHLLVSGNPVLYLDLDTTITGLLDGIALGHRFTVLENFWTAGKIGSGLMAWNMDLSFIYRAFVERPDEHMKKFMTRERFGDQGFIDVYSPVRPERWQTKHPGRVASYRRHCRAGVPRGVLVVCYGGKVRPWTNPLREEVMA